MPNPLQQQNSEWILHAITRVDKEIETGAWATVSNWDVVADVIRIGPVVSDQMAPVDIREACSFALCVMETKVTVDVLPCMRSVLSRLRDSWTTLAAQLTDTRSDTTTNLPDLRECVTELLQN